MFAVLSYSDTCQLTHVQPSLLTKLKFLAHVMRESMACNTDCAAAAISYLILGDLALNTLRSMVSAQWQDKAAWSTSTVIASTAEGAKQARACLHSIATAC